MSTIEVKRFEKEYRQNLVDGKIHDELPEYNRINDGNNDVFGNPERAYSTID